MPAQGAYNRARNSVKSLARNARRCSAAKRFESLTSAKQRPKLGADAGPQNLISRTSKTLTGMHHSRGNPLLHESVTTGARHDSLAQAKELRRRPMIASGIVNDPRGTWQSGKLGHFLRSAFFGQRGRGHSRVCAKCNPIALQLCAFVPGS